MFKAFHSNFDESEFSEFLSGIMPNPPGEDTELCPELEQFFMRFTEMAAEIVSLYVKNGLIEPLDSEEDALRLSLMLGQEILVQALQAETPNMSLVFDMVAALSAQRIFEESRQ